MQFIPAAAVASGAEGAFYQTDVDLNNAGSEPVEYQLMWLPRGEDNSEPMTSETFSLGAGMSVRYANVLAEVFDLQPDSLGALALVSSSPDLLAMSRTYNTPSGEPGGTFGQAIPAVAPGDFIERGERRRILFASEHADLRTNVGCQNGTDLFTADQPRALRRRWHLARNRADDPERLVQRSAQPDLRRLPAGDRLRGCLDTHARPELLLLRVGAGQRDERSDDDFAAVT